MNRIVFAYFMWIFHIIQVILLIPLHNTGEKTDTEMSTGIQGYLLSLKKTDNRKLFHSSFSLTFTCCHCKFILIKWIIVHIRLCYNNSPILYMFIWQVSPWSSSSQTLQKYFVTEKVETSFYDIARMWWGLSLLWRKPTKPLMGLGGGLTSATTDSCILTFTENATTLHHKESHSSQEKKRPFGITIFSCGMQHFNCIAACRDGNVFSKQIIRVLLLP